MKMKVCGHRLLVKLLPKEEEVALSDYLREMDFKVAHEAGMEKYEKLAAERGKVLQVGPTCWMHSDYGYGTPAWRPWCKVGDTILFGRYAGKLFEDYDTGDEYFILDDEAVQMVLEEAKDA